MTKSRLFSQIARSKPVLFVSAWFARICFELLYRTLRIHYVGVEHLPQTCIIALWHNRLLLAPLVTKRFCGTHFSVVVSKSRDGLLLARFAQTFTGTKIISVGHKSRNIALLEITKQLKEKTALLITPDGPRGPKYQIKPGLSFSAIHAQVPIVPMSWQAACYWQLPTWDEMQIPKPFSKVIVSFSDPIAPSNLSLQELDRLVAEGVSQW